MRFEQLRVRCYLSETKSAARKLLLTRAKQILKRQKVECMTMQNEFYYVIDLQTCEQAKDLNDARAIAADWIAEQVKICDDADIDLLDKWAQRAAQRDGIPSLESGDVIIIGAPCEGLTGKQVLMQGREVERFSGTAVILNALRRREMQE